MHLKSPLLQDQCFVVVFAMLLIQLLNMVVNKCMCFDNLAVVCVDNMHAIVIFSNLSECEEFSYYQIRELHRM